MGAPSFTTRPELVGDHGMVASTHWLASQSGMAVLERGGNAFDAAVAAGLVLTVVEPHLDGLGGDVPVIGCRAGGEPFVLCGQGWAPGAATPEAFEALGVGAVPGAGLLAAVVPGAFGTWLDLLGRYGTWRLADVAAYAIGYARDGFLLVPAASRTIGAVADLFRDHWPTSAATWLPGDRVPAARSRFRNPDLAHTLERLVAEGEAAGTDREAQVEAARRAFYEGFVAEAVDRFARTELMDATGTPHAGLLTGEDLAGWRVTEERPVVLELAGRTVAKTGPWGQGPVLLQQLAMLDHLGVADLPRGSTELVHTVAEVAKLAFADRDAWYADPAHVAVPLERLLSPAYTAERAALVGHEASAELRPGSPEGAGVPPRLPTAVLEQVAAARAGGRPARAHDGARPTGTGEPTFADAPPAGDGRTSGDTCHLDVVDAAGNVVSVTPSGGWLQSSPTLPGLGFQLPTRAQMFWVERGLPGTVAPHKRPRTTLSPTLVLRDGVPELACGTPGGDQQDQWQVPFLLERLLHGADLQSAIDAPTWHVTHLVSSFDPREVELRGLHVEERLGEDVVAGLRRRGHEVTVTGPWALGRLGAVARDPDGTLRGAADARSMQAYAVGR